MIIYDTNLSYEFIHNNSTMNKVYDMLGHTRPYHPNTFCSYWGTLIFHFFFTTFLWTLIITGATMFIPSLLYVFGIELFSVQTLLDNNHFALAVALAFGIAVNILMLGIAFLLSVLLCAYLLTKGIYKIHNIQDRLSTNNFRPASMNIVVEYFKAKKEKICPIIEYRKSE